jgi:hypothetical protein
MKATTMRDSRPSRPPVPSELDEWLRSALAKIDSETQVLRASGANACAAARDAVVRTLLEAARAWLDETITVPEATRLSGKCAETMRRAIRSGALPDLRSSPRAHHRTRRGAVLGLATKKVRSYDAVADAQDVAKLRGTGNET